MFKKFFISIVLSLFVLNATFAQSSTISNALSSGNASTIASYIDVHVSITILDNENTYTKQQAEMILKDFFAKHTPKSYATLHEGTSPEGSKFTVGSLVTSSGTYRTFFLIKQKGTSFTIQEIRFEAQ